MKTETIRRYRHHFIALWTLLASAAFFLIGAPPSALAAPGDVSTSCDAGTGIFTIELEAPVGWAPPVKIALAHDNNAAYNQYEMTDIGGGVYSYAFDTRHAFESIQLAFLDSTAPSPNILWGPGGPGNYWDIDITACQGSFGNVWDIVSRSDLDPAFVYTPSPDDWRDYNIYQIFTDRFFDGDPSNNFERSMRGGALIGWWSEGTAYPAGDTTGRPWYNYLGSNERNDRNLAQGGDYEGVRQKIPYLLEMGVNAVWMSSPMRVEQSPGNNAYTPYHAYHPTDHYTVEPLFGTMAKLRETIDELHANGIRVILDVVPNHLADLNYNTVNPGAFRSPCDPLNMAWATDPTPEDPDDNEPPLTHAPPYNWVGPGNTGLQYFHCNGSIEDYEDVNQIYIGAFIGTDDLNTGHPFVQQELRDSFKLLIEATDCDGFRVDAIKHIEPDYIIDWATDIREHAASLGKTDFLMFGEVFSPNDGDHVPFVKDVGEGFNSAMWFSLMVAMQEVFTGEEPTSLLTERLDGVLNGGTFGPEADPRTVGFFDNHDVDRVSLNFPNTWEAMLRPAMGIIYCGVPVPALYYGTEHGFDQGGISNGAGFGGDWSREDMWDWGFQPGNANGDKFSEQSDIKDLITTLNELRGLYPCLTKGNFELNYENDEGQGIYSFSRNLGDETAIVVLNTAFALRNFTMMTRKPDDTIFTDLLDPNDEEEVLDGVLALSIPARDLKIYYSDVADIEAGTVMLSGRHGSIVVGYDPTGGPLEGATEPILVIISKNGGLDREIRQMTDNGDGTWSFEYDLEEDMSIDFVQFSFMSSDLTPIIDNNGERFWTIDTDGLFTTTGEEFVMDGVLDSANYEICSNGMKLWAAIRGTKLYFATWSTGGGAGASSNDHFVYVAPGFGNPEPHPWGKSGVSHFYFGGWPWLGGEGDNAVRQLNNGGASGQSAEGVGGQVLEAVIDLEEVFGEVPERLYMAAVAYGSQDGGTIQSQCPATWDGNSDLEIMELQAVPTDSIRDSDSDGYFDKGRPSMTTVKEGVEVDADYNIRRFFVDETEGDDELLTVRFRPNINPMETISKVQLVTNINRREWAIIEPNRDVVTKDSDTYYRAYDMKPTTSPATPGDNWYEASLYVEKTGTYKATVRYFVDGQGPYYFNDNGLTRDLAVVVSPTKALDRVMYEANPLIIDAKDATFAGRSTFDDVWQVNVDRPDHVNTQYFSDLGINVIWLQPFHPAGGEAPGFDPLTGQPWEPGSPYAVEDYFSVTPALGKGNTAASALQEFQNFTASLDDARIDLMPDGTFNHSAPDAIIGQGAIDLGFPWATDPNAEIRQVRTDWFSNPNNYGTPATDPNQIAVAPDRSDFGKWNDVRDFFFGNYDALVSSQEPSHRRAYFLEEDRLDSLSTSTRQLWEYFAYYPIYWMEQTGHPVGTPPEESYKGIDGLRCDFAQGLPNEFWEYCMNKTKSVKWNFLFMAESLDGFATVQGDTRHGVGFRSARQFDILNENMVAYWRGPHFAYPYEGINQNPGTPNQTTPPFVDAWNARRYAFEDVVLLGNITSHDEVFPSDDPYDMLNAVAMLSSLGGNVPMLLYGQEVGALNDFATYGFRPGIPNADNNWTRYELNFGKSIPNFKAWNDMSKVFDNALPGLYDLYARLNNARIHFDALNSQNNYFMLRKSNGQLKNDLVAVGKATEPGVPVADQQVIMCFVAPNVNTTPFGTFNVDVNTAGGANWFGIESGRNYNVRDLLANDPYALLYPTDVSGASLLANGIFVGLDGAQADFGRAQYLHLIDRSLADGDGDGLPDDWETQYGLDPASSIGDNGANGDPDGDGKTNWQEWLDGTNPNDGDSHLLQAAFSIIDITPGAGTVTLTVQGTPGGQFKIQSTSDMETWTYVQDGGVDRVVATDSNTGLATVVIENVDEAKKVFYRTVAVDANP